MAEYRWTCYLCKASNDAGRSACEQCGFPAEATAEEIALAQSSRSANAVLQQRSQTARARANWKARPIWVKAGVVLTAIAVVVGGVLARFAPPLEYNLLGILILLGVLAALAIAHRWRRSK